MAPEIQPLTAERWDDLVALFRTSRTMSWCWCMWPRVMAGTLHGRTGEQNEAALRAMVSQGASLGLLAYLDGQPVGWCSVGARDAFVRFARQDGDDVWLVACVFVAPGRRGARIGHALLDAAAAYAAEHGAGAVEGPPTGWFPGDDRAGFDGVLRLFRSAGFEENPDLHAAGLMRRSVGGRSQPRSRSNGDLDQIRFLDAFQAWTRPRILDAARAAPVDGLHRGGLIVGGTEDGSLYATLAHLVGGEAIWLARWRGEPYATLPDTSDYPDLDALARAWESVEHGRRDWLARLQPRDLSRPVRYLSVTRGVMEQFSLWQTLFHAFNHTTHHRAEACVGLTALGPPPESIDMIDFMRDHA